MNKYYPVSQMNRNRIRKNVFFLQQHPAWPTSNHGRNENTIPKKNTKLSYWFWTHFDVKKCYILKGKEKLTHPESKIFPASNFRFWNCKLFLPTFFVKLFLGGCKPLQKLRIPNTVLGQWFGQEPSRFPLCLFPVGFNSNPDLRTPHYSRAE